ncbi:MAG: hypothetical protein JWM76_3811 [Pseudonocardiales bacterium]|nr:hypothetical protein [Pseudonocardiales bacterium]
MSLKTRYEFTLPRGYVDNHGRLHRKGVMRLATARDELEPLRDPTVSGPDDPRLTILVLTRVVETLGDMELVTSYDIEGLFAVDLAFLQDFYGVINFGSQDEYDALLQAQLDSPLLGDTSRPAPVEVPAPQPGSSIDTGSGGASDPTRSESSSWDSPSRLRAAVEEIPRRTS